MPLRPFGKTHTHTHKHTHTNTHSHTHTYTQILGNFVKVHFFPSQMLKLMCVYMHKEGGDIGLFITLAPKVL